MRSHLLSSALLALWFTVNANPVPSPLIPHEHRSYIPPGWKLTRKHHASAVLPLRFAIAQSNIESIEKYLYDVSHPESPSYGKHWSAGKVASTFAPSRESIDTVRDWLVGSGIEPNRIGLSASGGWVEFTATVQEAENLLDASYNVYGHETGAEHIACESYHLPEHVAVHVDFVTPTVHFDAKLSRRSGSHKALKYIGKPGSSAGPKMQGEVVELSSDDQLTNCDTQITPPCLRALYGLNYEPVSTEKNSFGIVEYTPQSYRQEDLNMFATAFSPDLYGRSPIMFSIDGGALNTYESPDINAESDLDLQYGMNLVTSKQDVSLYQVGDMVEGASFNNFLDAIDGSYCTFEGGDDPTQDGIYPDTQPGGYNGPEACGTVKPAYVISTSYGVDEAAVTIAYASRQCAEYAKLGLMGVTILYASGDDGVAGYGGYCLNPDGSETTDGNIFSPSFPSTCPYVTSVGATQVSPGTTVSDSESACEQVIYSGGGFSNYFAMPDYQQTAVTSYLTNNPPSYPASIWNSTGKVSASMPSSLVHTDISANGANYVIALDKEFILVYGTSASTPVVGAILTMVNDARIAQGKGPIGFINPTIYAANFSDAFHDITNGTNPGCGTLGFNTSKGWDPVTGLGTLNFTVLVQKWLDLP